MKLLSIIILIFLFAEITQADRTVTFTSDMTISSAAHTVDITSPSRWHIHLGLNPERDRWQKNGITLYPDKRDRTPAVITAQTDVKAQTDIYLVEAIKSGEYKIEGKGLNLSAIRDLKYSSIRREQNGLFSVYIRQDNNEYIIHLFPDGNETSRATTAKSNINAAFTTIQLAANTGKFYENR